MASGNGSIFSRQRKKIINGHFPNQSKDPKIKNLPASSTIISGDDKNEIHNANVQIFNQMTEEEVLKAHQNLMETMNPPLIAFLKSKRAQPSSKQISDMETQNETKSELKLDDIDTVRHILHQHKSEKWLHFDKFESNKLAWMKNVHMIKEKKSNYEAR